MFTMNPWEELTRGINFGGQKFIDYLPTVYDNSVGVGN